ncbi:hypothetical protein ACM01_36490 [Streptomyces viridochromogenes]|uniref:Uncharacterized protein n=1 Tax=Streptomyces viridochromogenes TaxID=1938 RepID=A0A0J7YZI7_STRVR|nr:hypothetical protein ACM01_36490 [Streptomyces viridochromogenes]KOG06964.1 hypothetical protein ADK35_44700 [Streptomyces viridochromogenes]KOG12171.1 hypothetical protein ADK36_35770 [Streptomyces viridochromogenes]
MPRYFRSGGTEVTDIFGLIAAIGVVASLLVSAWQTRELTRQTRISNGVAGAAAIYNGMERLHHVESLIAAQPELHVCFFGGAALPRQEDARARVLLIAAMLADTVNYGLMINALNPEMKGYRGWQSFALRLRDSAPVLVHVVNEHPHWWPALSSHWAAHPATGG